MATEHVVEGVTVFEDSDNYALLAELRFVVTINSAFENKFISEAINRKINSLRDAQIMFNIPDLDISWIYSSKNTPHKKLFSNKLLKGVKPPVTMEMYVNESAGDFAPRLEIITKPTNVVTLSIPLHVIVGLESDLSAAKLSEKILDRIFQQLKGSERCIEAFCTPDKLSHPEVFHYFLVSKHFTVIYPSGFSENELQNVRKQLHEKLGLDSTRPLLRRWNAWKEDNSSYLRNVHLGLSTTAVPDGEEHYVDGDYIYYHYMQGGIADNKWGCAYRSLQTLASWFRLQGYTNKTEPTHREIQDALVAMGDKEASFAGSRQWIGSSEVGFVLNQRYEIDSKILFVSSGAELASKGRDLVEHFKTHGTPVMIGGGVLAHTILGVSWSSATGDTRWLILDPHYTGIDDVTVIRKKGWVGWKGPDFWDQNAYYNMCMPQRPSQI